MCGIFGITGHQEAPRTIYNALERMAYRGYDSAGLAVTTGEGTLALRRAAGKIENLDTCLASNPVEGACGIGHTRWATHGGPSERNAHPHLSGSVAVVHNGIIENHDALRRELEHYGVRPASQTDSEIVALLVEGRRAAGRAPLDAVRDVLPRLEGAYALAFLFADKPDTIIAARQGSPLAIGLHRDMTILGSDAVSLAPLTHQACYLEDGDVALLTPGKLKILANGTDRVFRPARDISHAGHASDKAGFDHFMAKEIFEQPMAARRTLTTHLDPATGQPLGALADLDLSGISRLRLIACGTSFYAAQVARYWIEALTDWAVDVDIASEARYRDRRTGPHELGLFVSQSGETADTFAALEHMSESGARTVALVNTPESPIARAADAVLALDAGPEIGVASTKAFTCQLVALGAFALAAGWKASAPAGRLDALSQALVTIPRAIEQMLELDYDYAAAASSLVDARSAFFLGRGALFPVALEGALKLKEISYIHAEGYAAGELKHGPIALIDPQTPTLVLAPSADPLSAKTMSNAQEVSARGGPLFIITDNGENMEVPATILPIPMVTQHQTPFITAIATQMLAYHVACALGRDVDQPRNLAKSVCVE